MIFWVILLLPACLVWSDLACDLLLLVEALFCWRRGPSGDIYNSNDLTALLLVFELNPFCPQLKNELKHFFVPGKVNLVRKRLNRSPTFKGCLDLPFQRFLVDENLKAGFNNISCKIALNKKKMIILPLFDIILKRGFDYIIIRLKKSSLSTFLFSF